MRSSFRWTEVIPRAENITGWKTVFRQYLVPPTSDLDLNLTSQDSVSGKLGSQRDQRDHPSPPSRGVAREELPVVPEASNVIAWGLGCRVLNMGFDFSDFELGDFVVWAPVILVDERRCLLHAVTGGKPSRRFRDEEASDENKGWRDDLKSESLITG